MAKKYTNVKVQAISGAIEEPAEGKSASVTVKLQVVAGPRLGEVFTEYMYLSEKAQEYTIANLRLLGWSCNDITELAGLGSTTCDAGIYTDTYEGKSREKISLFKPRATIQGSAKKSFAAQFKALAASTPVVQVTDANKGLEELPIPVQSYDTEQEDEADLPF